MTFDMTTLEEELRRDEGERFRPYTDTVGKTTIGIGRNLTDVGISADESALMLTNDIARAVALLDRRVPWWRDLNDVRQRVLVNMCFNMGNALFSFVNTLMAMQAGKFDLAADGLIASKWREQVGDRAVRLADLMRAGVDS